MEAVSKVFTRVLLSEHIKLHPKSVSSSTHQVVLDKLREKVEGKCSRHGYIKRGTVEVYKTAPGRIELVGLNGFIQYNVHFYAEVCNPLVGSLVKCSVSNINKFGILAQAGFYSDSEFINVLEIIVAKNSVNIVSDVDLEKITIGDEVIVEVLGKKFELDDNKLSIVGRVVKDVDGASKKKKAAVAKQRQDDIEEEEREEVIEEGEVASEDEEGSGDDEASVEEEGSAYEEELEEEEEKSSRGGGGAFFSDNDSVADNYEMFSSASEGGDTSVEED